MTKLARFPHTPELLNVAKRVVWFEPPEKTLASPVHFLAHVMTHGTVDDVVTVRAAAGLEAFQFALEHAPPGIFDNRSWAYWNLVCGLDPLTPLPVRQELGLRSAASPNPGDLPSE